MLFVTAEILFWVCLAVLGYTYVGFPLLVLLVSLIRARTTKRGPLEPTISVIITAYNEERDLTAKLENTLALDYPASKLEIIVASDHSTDRTDEIVREFGDRGVKLWRQPERLGKTAAQNAAVEIATGEVILFSDATTCYEPNVLRVMMPNFADESVGCVAGRLGRAGSRARNWSPRFWGLRKTAVSLPM